MPCFCNTPADAARMRFNTGMSLLLPTVPLSMQLVAALPGLDPAKREDIQIEAAFESMRLPTINLGGGPLASIALTLSLAVGTFKIDNLPQLEFEMQQSAESFSKNVWPKLGWLTSLKIQPLLNLALAARLALDLQAQGIDPFNVQAGDLPEAPTSSSFNFRLTPPQLAMARLLAGLPSLLKMNEALNLPPIGDPESMSSMSHSLNGLAGLSPPSIQIPFPLILKLAMVLESLAKIQEAFGDEALSPSGMSSINAMLSLWARFNIPIPMPALALNTKLEGLPPLDDINLGEKIAGSSGTDFSSSFSPPKLAILPFLNVMIALHAALKLAVDIEPFDQCASCNCA